MRLTDWFGFISALSLVVVMMLSLHDWYYKKRADKLKHSMNLYKVFTGIDSEVNFDFNDYNIDNLKLKTIIQTNESPNDFNEADYFEEAYSHLEDNEYKNIRDIIKRKSIYINLYNLESQEFLIDLTKKIMATIPDMELWDELGTPPSKYYTKHLLKQIRSIVLWHYRNVLDKKRLSMEFTVSATSNNQYKLYRNYSLIGTDTESEINIIHQKIIKILVESLEQDNRKFNLLKIYFNIITVCCHSKLKKEIIQIKKDIDSNKPIKGKCRQCP